MKEAISAGKNIYEKTASLVEYDTKFILDTGTGNGEFVKVLRDEGYDKITCVDKENNLKYDGFELIEMDLNNDFDFDDETFDAVTSLALIEHLENPRHFLRECKRVTKSGGYILLSTPNVQHFRARLKFLVKGVIYGFDVNDYEISGHITPITSYDIYRICNELNLKVESFDYNDSKKAAMIVKIRKP